MKGWGDRKLAREKDHSNGKSGRKRKRELGADGTSDECDEEKQGLWNRCYGFDT